MSIIMSDAIYEMHHTVWRYTIGVQETLPLLKVITLIFD